MKLLIGLFGLFVIFGGHFASAVQTPMCFQNTKLNVYIKENCKSKTGCVQVKVGSAVINDADHSNAYNLKMQFDRPVTMGDAVGSYLLETGEYQLEEFGSVWEGFYPALLKDFSHHQEISFDSSISCSEEIILLTEYGLFWGLYIHK